MNNDLSREFCGLSEDIQILEDKKHGYERQYKNLTIEISLCSDNIAKLEEQIKSKQQRRNMILTELELRGAEDASS